MTKRNGGTVHKIGYIFFFLFLWYGISWFLYPRIIDIIGMETNAMVRNISYMMGGILIVISGLILIWAYLRR